MNTTFVLRGHLRITGLLLLIAAMNSLAAADCELTIARLRYDGGGDWYANPSSLPNLTAAVRERTQAPVCDTVATVSILDEGLFRYPFLYMTGHGNVQFSHRERLRLRRYLVGGGFLWADDNYGLDESFRRQMQELFPENPLVALPSDHALFRSHYSLPGLPKIHEHDGEPAAALGIFFQDRLIVLYTYSSDIGDGMEDLHVHNDGAQLHELALKMGVNIVSWFFEQ